MLKIHYRQTTLLRELFQQFDPYALEIFMGPNINFHEKFMALFTENLIENSLLKRV